MCIFFFFSFWIQNNVGLKIKAIQSMLAEAQRKDLFKVWIIWHVRRFFFTSFFVFILPSLLLFSIILYESFMALPSKFYLLHSFYFFILLFFLFVWVVFVALRIGYIKIFFYLFNKFYIFKILNSSNFFYFNEIILRSWNMSRINELELIRTSIQT